ncbi:SAV_2336 N-terminal domain-related protein [Streptomyces sp. NPDC001617]
MSVEPFRSVLARLGLDPTPRELAEILWLATRLPAASPSAGADARAADSSQPPAGRAGETVPVLPSEPAVPDAKPAIPVYAPTTAPGSGDASRLPATPVRLAAAPPLPRRLELLRALRPLKLRVPSRHVAEIDEEATVESMARRSAPHRKGTVLPVLRPAPERWLDVVLVVDGHPTGLLLWTPLVREVRRLLVQVGAFRDVRLRYLHVRPDGSPGLSVHPAPDPDRTWDPAEIHDPSGRRLVLVLTDGVAPRWQNPSVREAMRQWAAVGPLAVLQALPEGLWRRTALPAVPAQLRRAPLSAANTDLVYTGRRRGKRRLAAGSIPVPVLQPSPEWLKPWARLVAGSGSPTVDSAVTLLAADSQPQQAVTDDRSPTRRLNDFHATASPEAFRLLACLSAVPLTVAIMRVVQAAVLPGTPPTVLAEVMFSGLVTPTDTVGSIPPTDVPYDFLPGVRADLLQSLRTHEVDQILREVSGFVERGGTAGRVSGLLPDPAGDAELTADGIPWARLREEALARAGLVTPADRIPAPSVADAEPTTDGVLNPYELVATINTADFSDVYLGIDSAGHQAVVKVPPPDAYLEPEAFQALVRVEAEALRRMDGRYAPPLLGIDRQASPTWLAMGLVTSISGDPAFNLLSRPWWDNGPPDDLHALSQLARRLAEALERAHSAGIVHGNLGPHAVMLVPDSVVLISWVYAQFDGQPHPYPQRRELASGYMPPEGYPLDEPLDPSFDMYGLGAILLHEATRRRFATVSRSALPQLPSHLGDLRELIGRCLDADPSRRPTVRQFLDGLEGVTLPQEPVRDAEVDRDGPWGRLDSLPGFAELKLFLAGLRAETLLAEGRAWDEPTAPYLVFSGNLGTGKTTAAQLVGEIFRDLGLLDRGHLVTVRMSDLVLGHPDQSVDLALDGVLFIEDVYGPERRRDYGDKAMRALLGQMEAHRDRLAVIFAGSPENVREFLAANPLLVRRIPEHHIIEFPGLGPDTLMAILEGRFVEGGLRLADGVVERLRQIVDEMYRTRNEDFAGGREMVALARAVSDRWAQRVMPDMGEPVTVEDIPESYRAYLPAPAPDPSALLAELDDHVWPGPVREVLEDLIVLLGADRTWNDGTPPHLVFTGPPGTGKSTVARFVGKVFRELGLLRKGHVVEVTRTDLVADHVGQTTSLVRSTVQTALDGVLFIDRAYSLAWDTEGGGGFGAEAIDTLLQEMERWRGRLVVILAGHPREMTAFLSVNSGLPARFGLRVDFPDYDTADLVDILRRLAAQSGYDLAPGVPARAAAWLDATRVADPSGFANARTVRELLGTMEGNLAGRFGRLQNGVPEFRVGDVPDPPELPHT